MDAKLTLKLDKSVIERAKKYASEKKLSLSSVIENYLDSLTRGQDGTFEISPFVKSISNGNKLPTEINSKQLRESYTDFLDRKYQ
ncbi:MAG: DUF6364 family protein [Chitinophagaceae bacterium]